MPFIRRSLQLWILVAGHLFAAIFVKDLGYGLDQIDDATVKNIAFFLKETHSLIRGWIMPVMLVLVVAVQIQIARAKPVQRAVDVVGGLLAFRCLTQFLMLNLLLLSRLKAGGLLLLELLLFIPVITITFGWLYWRLDSSARARGGTHIRFSEEAGSLDPFDYFHASAMTLLQFEPSGATATSRLMKTLFVIHGAMMLDLVALTLSRAIGLASG
ncbi:MAG: hypothetical protein EBR40_00715 [Proteobacteria bacterium]|jgi:hypothetical protein|nr:hypothetical protein [Pseudomonadota bacterium]